MPIADAYNYREISETVATSGIPTEEQLSGLKTEGFAAVINLLPDESSNAVAGEEDIIRDQGLEYYHIPVDFEDPTDEDFNAFTDALEGLGDQKILVHCASNFRASAFFALYAMKHIEWSEEQADELIDSLWDPIANPPWDQFIEDMRD